MDSSNELSTDEIVLDGATAASTPPAISGRHDEPQEYTIPMLQKEPDNVVVRTSAKGITLLVKNAPVSAVLSELAKSQNLDMVVASSAESRITLSMNERSLEETLDAVLAAGGLTWVSKNDVIYVTGLNNREQINPALQGRKLMIFELDYASAEDVDTAVEALLSPVGQSWVNTSLSSDNRRTKNLLTVEDLPAYLARIEEYISLIDQPPKQVVIEVQVLQIELDKDNRHGVNLNNVAKVGGLEMTFDAKGFADASAPQAFFLQAQAANLTGLVEAIKTTTDAKTLASPRILALNGQEARMQVGEQLGFRVTTTTETSTLESVEFLDVGVVLRVTPYISRDGHVLMRVHPEVSSGAVNPQTGLPEEETTEVETDILLASGQGMVVGGLIQETDDVKSSGYLGLGNAPFIGPLFKRKTDYRKRSEIVIALVPHVLPLHDNQEYSNDFNVQRTQEPLLYGPLCRNPRPYEVRLRESRTNHLSLWERKDCNCDHVAIERLPMTYSSTEEIGPLAHQRDPYIVPIDPATSRREWQVRFHEEVTVPVERRTTAWSESSIDGQRRMR